MAAGVYLLAGPFREERTSPGRRVPLWIVLQVYEFLVIGAVALLRRRDLDTLALRIVSIFVLADPVFMGDAFASTHLGRSLALNGAAAAVSLLKAWALARACLFRVTPWPAGWVAGAIGFIHGVPSLIAWASTQPALVQNAFLAAGGAGAAVAVALLRKRDPSSWLGTLGAAVAGMAAHWIASGIVNGVTLESSVLMPPLAAIRVGAPRGRRPAFPGARKSGRPPELRGGRRRGAHHRRLRVPGRRSPLEPETVPTGRARSRLPPSRPTNPSKHVCLTRSGSPPSPAFALRRFGGFPGDESS